MDGKMKGEHTKVHVGVYIPDNRISTTKDTRYSLLHSLLLNYFIIYFSILPSK